MLKFKNCATYGNYFYEGNLNGLLMCVYVNIDE